MTRSRSCYYPIGLSLEGQPCLVVGGGPVAQRKIATLLRYGARVTVISPTVTETVRRWARAGTIRYDARPFRASDINTQRLVYGATDDRRTQRAVFSAARRKHIFVNIVDEPSLCSFIAPAQVKRGNLTIAISTGGRAPGLAKRVRQDIERAIGPEYGQLLRLLERARPAIRAAVPTVAGRKRALQRLIDEDVLSELRRGHHRSAARRSQRSLTEALQRWSA